MEYYRLKLGAVVHHQENVSKTVRKNILTRLNTEIKMLTHILQIQNQITLALKALVMIYITENNILLDRTFAASTPPTLKIIRFAIK